MKHYVHIKYHDQIVEEKDAEIAAAESRLDWTVLQNAKAQAAIPDDLIPGGGGKTLPERVGELAKIVAVLTAKVEAAEGLMVVTERCGAFASTIGTLHSPLLLAINDALEAARKAGLEESK